MSTNARRRDGGTNHTPKCGSRIAYAAATRTLNPKAKPDRQQKSVDPAIAKLLKNDPPPVMKYGPTGAH